MLRAFGGLGSNSGRGIVSQRTAVSEAVLLTARENTWEDLGAFTTEYS